MLGFKAHKGIAIKAAPEVIFDIVADIPRHHELAGSGEVLRIRQLTEGPIRVGSKFEADEEVAMGPTRSKFVSRSEVVAFDRPTVLSWTSMPPSAPKPKRIQWWFRLSPQDGGTRVAHQVEVDFGLVSNYLLKLPYRLMRGGRINKGMERTLQNLKQLAEQRAAKGR